MATMIIGVGTPDEMKVELDEKMMDAYLANPEAFSKLIITLNESNTKIKIKDREIEYVREDRKRIQDDTKRIQDETKRIHEDTKYKREETISSGLECVCKIAIDMMNLVNKMKESDDESDESSDIVDTRTDEEVEKDIKENYTFSNENEITR